MTYQQYCQIALLMLNSNLFTDAFSIPQFLTNVAAQGLGYGFGVLTERPIDAAKLLPPIISYAPQTYEFINSVTGATRNERVATLAFLLSGTGLLSKTGDPVVNAGAGGFIYLLAQYIEALGSSGSGGSTPFAVFHPNRKLRRFSRKEHLKCQLAIVGVLIITTGCSYVVVVFTKKLMKGSKKFFKKSIRIIKNLRIKPWHNSNSTPI